MEERQVRELGRWGVRALSWFGLFYLTAPLLVVIAVSVTETAYLKFPPQGFSLRWYYDFLKDPTYIEAFWLSAKLGAVATALSLLLGVPTALVIARKRFPGRQALSSIFLSPLILPTIVIGVAILQYASLLGFSRTFSALVVGHVVLVVPYVVRTTLASLHGLDNSIEEAAQDLGATPAQTFFLVTLPQIKPGVIAGALFAFINSWINVEVSIFNTTTASTLPVKIFNYVQFNVDPILAAVSSVTIYIAILAVVLLDVFIGVEKATAST
ncbi:MAG: ABC transporter permease [Rhodospirillales bacterium]|nr:ABC transporter permease [Rhodospirillales bacterium]